MTFEPSNLDNISPRLLSVLRIRDVFFNPKIVLNSEIFSGIFFPDPDLDFYPSQIPNPDSQHWLLWPIPVPYISVLFLFVWLCLGCVCPESCAPSGRPAAVPRSSWSSSRTAWTSLGWISLTGKKATRSSRSFFLVRKLTTQRNQHFSRIILKL